MAQQHPEDKKMDLSSFPRGAIGIKGLPVSRNTRLPSIRTPRDLTLGAPTKRTFMPNIPVRREKKPQIAESTPVKQENVIKSEPKRSSQTSERGRGKGRTKNIIQTQSSIFSEGIAASPLSHKDKVRASYSSSTSSRSISIKKEKEDKDMAQMNAKMHNLFRDDFIDDGESDDFIMKPIIYPAPPPVKDEADTENADTKKPDTSFDPNVAEEMGFDVKRVAKFIKKEKGAEIETENIVKPSPALPKEASILSIDEDSSKLVLLKFPDLLNVAQKSDEFDPQQRVSQNADPKVSENQNTSLGSINCLPEGYVGKLQVLKSGKTRLVIGNMTYTLNSVASLNRTKHELVSLSTETKDLCMLGNIKEALSFVPSHDTSQY